MTLLHAAVEARALSARFPVLHAVTIDHALRPESADEARFVGEACARFGVSHETIRLDRRLPEAGMQAAARRARLRALRDVALQAEGEAVILLAHTRDDVAETAFMRAARSDASQPSIAPALFLQPGWAFRPFLGLDRALLRAWLRERGGSWRDDPSNDDERFERVRVRRRLAHDPAQRASVLAIAKAADREHRALSRRAARLLAKRTEGAQHAFRDANAPRGVVDGPVDASDPALVLALRAVLANVGGRAHMPSSEATRRLLNAVGRRRHGAGRAVMATLAGCTVRGGDALLIRAENRRGAAGPIVSTWPPQWGYAPPSLEPSRAVASERWGAAVLCGRWAPASAGPVKWSLYRPRGVDAAGHPLDPRLSRLLPSSESERDGLAHAYATTACGLPIVSEPLVRTLNPWAEMVPEHDWALADVLSRLVLDRPLPTVPLDLGGDPAPSGAESTDPTARY